MILKKTKKKHAVPHPRHFPLAVWQGWQRLELRHLLLADELVLGIPPLTDKQRGRGTAFQSFKKNHNDILGIKNKYIVNSMHLYASIGFLTDLYHKYLESIHGTSIIILEQR